MLAGADDRGVVVRGLGRSYGDAAQNAGGTVADLTGWHAIVEVDTEACTARVEAGASIGRVLDAVLPRGMWLPVLPGTRQVTVGGAVCADVHGKNHHGVGSFGHHVTNLSILLASGDVVEATPHAQHADLFWATVGGLGLTGVVLEATIRLVRVESAFMVVDTERIDGLGSLLRAPSGADDEFHHWVAWLDPTSRAGTLGRAVVTRANAAKSAELACAVRSRPLEHTTPARGRVPFRPPIGLVNRFTAQAFNALWYRRAPSRRVGEIQDVTAFFHPLDAVEDWNRAYGPRGLCQYQFVVPFGEEAAFVEAVRTIGRSGHVSSLSVLKRLGAANASPMSFPLPGWTLAADFPVRAGLDGLLDHLDRLVLAAGGRVYLAKDSRAGAATIVGMYPRLDEFRAVRAVYDPRRRFWSDLARRLEL